MNLLLIGQGKYFWQLIQKILELHHDSNIFIISTDTEAPNNLKPFSNFSVLNLEFDGSDSSWDKLSGRNFSNLDCLVSFQFPFRVPIKVLSYFKESAWNLHTAPLPEFGGWNGSSHAIIEEFGYFGPTLHAMTEIIDGGPVIQSDYFRLIGTDTSYAISEESKKRGISLVITLLDDFVNGREINVTEKSQANRKFYSKSELEKYRIVSWKEGPQTISKIARAFSHPNFPGAILDLGQGQRVEIKNLPGGSDN
jgi:methionyl-tRNA formyltransferase